MSAVAARIINAPARVSMTSRCATAPAVAGTRAVLQDAEGAVAVAAVTAALTPVLPAQSRYLPILRILSPPLTFDVFIGFAIVLTRF